MTPMDVELTLNLILNHAARRAGDVEIVTHYADGWSRRYTYAELGRRAAQLGHALDTLGIERGEVVATLAANSDRHMECYFGIPCAGRVLHTLNPRLSVDDLGYVIERADDRAIFVDPELVPLLESVAGALDRVRTIVILGDTIPPTSLRGVVAYEELIGGQPDELPAPESDERSPLGICFTTGTTGRPKGVVYSHRSAVLHAFAAASGAGLGIGPEDCVCAMVPMFHANCFGLPHAAALVGAKHVLYAGAFNPTTYVDLLIAEHVTFSAAVPTIWQAVATELRRRGPVLPDLKLVITAGAKPPASLVDLYWDEFKIPMVQAYGMTEASPLVGVCRPKHHMRDWDAERRASVVRRQAALPLAGIELSLRGADGSDVPWDGAAMGAVHLRGPWVLDSYLGEERDPNSFSDDGWFAAGDVAIGSPDGYLVIADRTKDLVKSGGEWISSVAMENAIRLIAGVADAAVIAIPDARWDERPLPCVVLDEAATIGLDDVRTHLVAQGFPRWQLPDRIEIVPELPRTTVGKLDKKTLRDSYSGARVVS
jgi:fatty-acyl-CoA synthase